MRVLLVAVLAALLGVAAALGLRSSADPAREPEVAQSRQERIHRLNDQLRNVGAPARVRAAEEESIETRPDQPGYDPLQISSVLGTSPSELYQHEPVVLEFAERREAFMRVVLEQDIAEHFPDATMESVDCRTSICRVDVIAPREEGEDLSSYVQLPPFGDEQQVSLDRSVEAGRARVTMFVLFGLDRRDHSDYEAFYNERRARFLDDMRHAGMPAPSR